MDERSAHVVRLLKEPMPGTLDALECPSCHRDSVSVWFTHPGDGIYRTWFICSECSFQLRAQNVGLQRTTRKTESLRNWKTTMKVCLRMHDLRDLKTRREKGGPNGPPQGKGGMTPPTKSCEIASRGLATPARPAAVLALVAAPVARHEARRIPSTAARRSPPARTAAPAAARARWDAAPGASPASVTAYSGPRNLAPSQRKM